MNNIFKKIVILCAISFPAFGFIFENAVNGVYAGILTIAATMIWGIRGGVPIAIYSSVVMFGIAFQDPQFSKSAASGMAVGVVIYVSIAVGLGYAIDAIRRKNRILEEKIEELNRTKEELKTAIEALEAANLAKSQFLANMSYEIRTPMNAITGFTELALSAELSVETRGYLDIVKTSADNLLSIINDILDLSKIEAGKVDIEEIDFDLYEVVKSVTDSLSIQAQAKGLELFSHTEQDVPELLTGDPLRLRQVLVNLVGNAVKFTTNGEVSLYVNVESRDDKNVKVRFSIKDTGIGIPEDKIHLLFKSFSQLDTSSTRKYGGSGLGLSISKQLVQMMGGTIWIDSEVGRGSTFSFNLPFKIPKETEKQNCEIQHDIKPLSCYSGKGEDLWWTHPNHCYDCQCNGG